MTTAPQIAPPEGVCRVLSLDGGGAKGFYTLGVLAQVEAMVGKPLCEHFHLIFGTSTGAIIAALLSLGYKVKDILDLYRRHVPTVMKHRPISFRISGLIRGSFDSSRVSDSSISLRRTPIFKRPKSVSAPW
jgi:predicted acylesterase/phospholipase RssA